MNAGFDPEALTQRIKKLLDYRNESLHEAVLESGLDHQALRRFMTGQRPNMIACILLADHFGGNPHLGLTRTSGIFIIDERKNQLVNLADVERGNLFRCITN